MVRVYNSSLFLLPYVEKVLKRDNVSYKVKRSNNPKIEANLTGKQFHRVVQDARCEVKREESYDKIPIFTMDTVRDNKKFNRLLKQNRAEGYTGFKILKIPY